MPVKNFIRPTTDGRLACENDERAFWQSRMTTGGKVAPLPEIVDVPALARELAERRRVAKQMQLQMMCDVASATEKIYRSFAMPNFSTPYVPVRHAAVAMRGHALMLSVLKETTP